MKKILLFLTLLPLMASADVEINETNFPDAGFLKWILAQDYGQDGVLTSDEIEGITQISIYGEEMKSLKGIEYFTELMYLYCTDNSLTSLDLSKNTKLSSLYCYNNYLTSLNISGCTELSELECYQNALSGKAMDDFIAGLPEVNSWVQKELRIIYNFNEANFMTESQVAAAQEKGWNPMRFMDYYMWDMYYADGIETAGAETAIDATNFPDENFRNLVLSQRYGADGVLTEAEIESITDFQIYDTNIEDLRGIELFTKLSSIYCGKNKLLTTIDVSGCKELTSLECYKNENLTTLNVSGCTKLTDLSVRYSPLSTLDLSKNTSLYRLTCENNSQLTALNLQNNLSLGILFCEKNRLSSLDLSNNTKLGHLDCADNQLTSLDLSMNPELNYIECVNNQLTALDLSKNTKLRSLYCYKNQINGTQMDALIASLPNVEEANMYVIYNEGEGNAITETQVQNAKTKGWKPRIYDGKNWNILFEDGLAIDETHFPDENFRNWLLSQSYGEDGILTESEIGRTTSMQMDGKGIRSLQGIEIFNKLSDLQCSNNHITALDLSSIPNLSHLDCSGNQLTTLDMSKNLELQWLQCENNQLTSLDLSNITGLWYINCSNNLLTSLEVSANEWLNELYCFNNRLTTLNLSGMSQMRALHIYQNRIRGKEMDTLVNSLSWPEMAMGTPLASMYVIYNEEEGNIMTTSQVETAKNMGWLPCFYNGNYWESYDGKLDGVDINETNFPDEKFRNWVFNSFGQDGVLTDDEIAKTDKISMPMEGIKSLKGIEYFTALGTLYFGDNQVTTLDVSKNTELTFLGCSNNQLTSLDVSNNTKLTYLSCDRNNLTSLDVSQNTALKTLYIYNNQIKGAEMDALVESLPTVSDGAMYVIYDTNEGNVMTTIQVADAKAKGWTPKCMVNGRWQDYEGSEPEVKKCATPVIAFYDGKLIFRCQTEDVEYKYQIATPVMSANDGNNVTTPTKIQLIVYATKEGYEPSDAVTNEIDLSALIGKLGDVNGDGVVNGTDIQEVINIIVNAE